MTHESQTLPIHKAVVFGPIIVLVFGLLSAGVYNHEGFRIALFVTVPIAIFTGGSLTWILLSGQARPTLDQLLASPEKYLLYIRANWWRIDRADLVRLLKAMADSPISYVQNTAVRIQVILENEAAEASREEALNENLIRVRDERLNRIRSAK